MLCSLVGIRIMYGEETTPVQYNPDKPVNKQLVRMSEESDLGFKKIGMIFFRTFQVRNLIISVQASKAHHSVPQDNVDTDRYESFEIMIDGPPGNFIYVDSIDKRYEFFEVYSRVTIPVLEEIFNKAHNEVWNEPQRRNPIENIYRNLRE